MMIIEPAYCARIATVLEKAQVCVKRKGIGKDKKLIFFRQDSYCPKLIIKKIHKSSCAFRKKSVLNASS